MKVCVEILTNVFRKLAHEDSAQESIKNRRREGTNLRVQSHSLAYFFTFTHASTGIINLLIAYTGGAGDEDDDDADGGER